MKSKINKEEFKKFLNELFATKFSKEKLFPHLKLNEDEEVCIEPFAYIDADGDVLPIVQYDELNPEEFSEFQNLADLEMCPGIEIHEEDIVSDEIIDLNEKVELDKEEIEAIQKIADEIEPIEAGICIPCLVNDKESYLIDGVNCNIKEVSILGISLITPLNLQILKLSLDSDMESEKDIELTVALKAGENMLVYKLCLGVLLDAGIVSVVDQVELELSPLEHRCLMKHVDANELAELLKY